MGQKVMPKNIVVVGGGTAGWLTALYAKKQLPNDNITVIESAEIGILGAGEGSTPMLVQFLEDLGISIFELDDYKKSAANQSKIIWDMS